jgi:hypothetical protein
MEGYRMAEEKLNEGSKVPYLNAYGVITKTLDKIIQAATPMRFTQDFLSTKLAIKGGSAKPVIPFLKRTGFINSDGSPTDLYNKFRNDSLRGGAAASALGVGFETLYEMNEYVHDLNDNDLKSLIVQATGAASGSSTVKAIVGSFKALRAYADFDAKEVPAEGTPEEPKKEQPLPSAEKKAAKSGGPSLDLKLGYTINLNLPATTDIAVYDAIFKSLKGHLLEQ